MELPHTGEDRQCTWGLTNQWIKDKRIKRMKNALSGRQDAGRSIFYLTGKFDGTSLLNKKALRANDAHSREDEECRRRPRETPECAKAHSFLFTRTTSQSPKGTFFFNLKTAYIRNIIEEMT